MPLESAKKVTLPVRSYFIEGFQGSILAHHSNETWNGYECPLFSLEQSEAFVRFLNADDEFEASLENGVVEVHIISSGEKITFAAEDGFIQFHGWCFNSK